MALKTKIIQNKSVTEAGRNTPLIGSFIASIDRSTLQSVGAEVPIS